MFLDLLRQDLFYPGGFPLELPLLVMMYLMLYPLRLLFSGALYEPAMQSTTDIKVAFLFNIKI